MYKKPIARQSKAGKAFSQNGKGCGLLACFPAILAHKFHLVVQKGCSVSISYDYIPFSKEEKRVASLPPPFKGAFLKAHKTCILLARTWSCAQLKFC